MHSSVLGLVAALLCSCVAPESTAIHLHGEVVFEVAEGPFACPVGDVDADGIADIAVSNRNLHRDSDDRQNTVRVFSGRTGKVILRLAGEDGFGYRVAAAGDVDADGHADLLVTTGDVYGRDDGLLEVVSGKSGATLHRYVGGNLGHDIDGIGDINADGHADFAYTDVSERRRDVIRACSGADGVELWTYDTRRSARGFSYLVLLGDLDRDGVRDIAVPGVGGGVQVLSGRTGEPHLKIDASLVGGEAHESIAPLTDVNGDGIPDLILGNSASRAAFVVSGSDGTVLAQVNGDRPDDDFGWSVTGLSDLDGDGISDFAVGAPTFHSFDGTAYVRVFSGRTAELLLTIDGEVEDGSHPFDIFGSPHAFGVSLCSLNDVGGSGWPGLLIGEDRYFNTGSSLPDRTVLVKLLRR